MSQDLLFPLLYHTFLSLSSFSTILGGFGVPFGVLLRKLVKICQSGPFGISFSPNIVRALDKLRRMCYNVANRESCRQLPRGDFVLPLTSGSFCAIIRTTVKAVPLGEWTKPLPSQGGDYEFETHTGLDSFNKL
jgi:hypothetical protein